MDQFNWELTSRRRMLKSCATGFGALALAALAEESSAAAPPRKPRGRLQPHFPARAKRVIFLFMKGGPSHVDTFDPKPLLQRDNGKELPFAKPRVQFAPTGKLLASPWKFQKYGQSGIEVSSLFPNVARCVDDLCIINSVHGTNAAHGGACLKLHTGSDSFVRPSMGSWITYGLGTENQDLPGVRHDLPDAGPRRRSQLGFGVPARPIPRNAARQRERCRPIGPAFATSRTSEPRATFNACNSTCSRT